MNGNLERWIEKVDKKLDNHISKFVPRLTAVETNQKWLMRFFWVFMTPILGGVAYIIFQIK